jgi:hypothetical protein
MKYLLVLIALLVVAIADAQQSLPLIRATSTKAKTIEGNDEPLGWMLDSAIKPDVYTLTKSVTKKSFRFITDIDSIQFVLKPGETRDFIVLLNGKDSCYTRVQSPTLKNYVSIRPSTHDTIPFELTDYDNLKIKAVVNSDTLDLKFDSGTTGLVLTRDAVKNKTKGVTSGNQLQIGNMIWKDLPVYLVELSGQGTDGRFGWDLFDGKIVEMDYDNKWFIVHSQLPYKPGKTFARFPMEYSHTLFCINAELEVKGKKYPGRFLFDNGYQRTIMLDTVVMHEQQFPRDQAIIRKVIMRDGQGKEVPVITVEQERFNLGKYALANIPVQLMTRSNPARFKTHILGNEILKRFNTILDFQKNVVYLKPNRLLNEPYKEAK